MAAIPLMGVNGRVYIALLDNLNPNIRARSLVRWSVRLIGVSLWDLGYPMVVGSNPTGPTPMHSQIVRTFFSISEILKRRWVSERGQFHLKELRQLVWPRVAGDL